jgi:hypothetical protein
MQMAQDFAVGIRTTLVSSNDGAGLSRAAEVIAIKKSLEARGPPGLSIAGQAGTPPGHSEGGRNTLSAVHRGRALLSGG